VEVQLKDLDIALEEAGELNLRLPLTQQVADMFRRMVDSGQSGLDHSALVIELERMNGLSRN